MPTGKEIRGKIGNFQSTKKITKAMEMISVSKMRKAQDRMRAARPYSEKVRAIVAHLRRANAEYQHPYMRANQGKQAVVIAVTTDKGLCGGLNTNILRVLVTKARELKKEGLDTAAVAIGNKGLGFFNRTKIPVMAHVTQLGDQPSLERLIGPVKVALDAFERGEVGAVYLAYSKFVNTMRQEPVLEQILPLTPERLDAGAQEGYSWDYLYEPDAETVIDDLLVRYVEGLVYEAVAESMASEQAARMVAMKAATDNAGNMIAELQLAYNKTRQAAITKELSEIVSGAAAIGG